MALAKRILLFILTNILVVITINIILSILGVQYYASQQGIQYQQLMIFCLVWGFAGALISLALSRVMAKWMMGVKIISPDTREPQLRDLYMTVERLARSAGLTQTPQVGIYDSPEMNAFATGPTKKRSLVAVSTGLLNRMDRGQVEGVLGHEIAHITNGDMVTMTLLQGVINAFVMFFARIIAFALSQNVRDENRHTVQWVTTLVLEMVLSLLGFMIVAAFSRWREFRADRGGAQLTGREKMINALRGLQKQLETPPADEPASIAAFKISGKSRGIVALFATHPPLEDRIQRLQTARA